MKGLQKYSVISSVPHRSFSILVFMEPVFEVHLCRNLLHSMMLQLVFAPGYCLYFSCMPARCLFLARDGLGRATIAARALPGPSLGEGICWDMVSLMSGLSLRTAFQSLFSWNLPSDSADFRPFSSFLSVKPAFSFPPPGMNAIYWIPYKFIPVSWTAKQTPDLKTLYISRFLLIGALLTIKTFPGL